MGGSNRQTTTSSQSSSVDPGTSRYIEAYRQQALGQPQYQQGMGGIDQYYNPYQQQVIGQIQSEGNRQAGFANQQAADMATRAGAYGGGREAVLRAQMMGDVQRQTGQNVAQYSASGYDQAAQNMFQDRMNAANVGFGRLGAMTPGFTPTTQTQLGTQTQESPNSLWPQLLGAGLTVGGALLGGPAGAAAGGSLGGMISNPQGRMAQGGGLNWGGMGMQPNLGFGGYQPQGGMNWGSLGPWGRRVR